MAAEWHPKNVMAALLAEVKEGIKGFPCLFAFRAICANIGGQLARSTPMAKAGQVRKPKGESPSSGAWEQISTPHGGFREGEVAPGRFQLPPNSIDNLKALGFTNDEIYRIVAPRRTLARRKELNQRLTTSESDRVLRLERLSAMADRVFADQNRVTTARMTVG